MDFRLSFDCCITTRDIYQSRTIPKLQKGCSFNAILHNQELLRLSQNCSFPKNLKLPVVKLPVSVHSDVVCVSTDENLEELVSLEKIDGVPEFLRKEGVSRRVFIQEPSWVSSLFMSSLFVRSTKVGGVRRDFRDIERRRKYGMLRRRQIKAETEAWEEMVEEYRELEREMCEKKLAPNLPYVKKLMLGWFEPLRQGIEKEQKAEMTRKHRAAYSPYIDSLPADKMAVIVMHKLMGLLMMGGKEERCVQVVQAAVQIGMAVENEVSVAFS